MYRILIIETGEYALRSHVGGSLFSPEEVVASSDKNSFVPAEWSSKKEVEYIFHDEYDFNVGINGKLIFLKNNRELFEIVEV